jgi:GNAT superfamily N-acetyltransferase
MKGIFTQPSRKKVRLESGDLDFLWGGEPSAKRVARRAAARPQLVFNGDEDYEGDPWELAKSVGVNILSNKDFQAGFSVGGELVAALFDASDSDGYEFDIAVRRDWQRKGLGAKLMDLAFDTFDENQEAFGEDYTLNLDVISPIAEKMLKRRGLVEVGRERGHVLMSRRAVLRQAPEPGVKTFVLENTETDEVSPSALPPGSATPGGAGREIPQFSMAVPDSESNIQPRTLAVPGEEWGNPVNDGTSMFKRRALLEKTALRPQTKIPSDSRYYARLFRKGIVTHYREGPGGRPEALPGDVVSYYDNVHRKGGIEGGVNANSEWDLTPERLAIAKELVRLGLYRTRARKIDYPDTAFKYRKSWPPSSDWEGPEDVPEEALSYGHKDYTSWEDTVLVDTEEGVVSLDASWTRSMNRRPGAKPGKGSNSSYVIPSGDVAFGTNKTGLRKILKYLLAADPRVTSDFKIVGDEGFFGMTLGEVLGGPQHSNVSVGNSPKGVVPELVAYHGTSMKWWKEVQSKGLRPGERDQTYVDLIPGYSSRNVYLTFDVSDAENYATRESIWSGGRPLVLKVVVPDPSKIVADEDVLGILNTSREYHLERLDGRERILGQIHMAEFLRQISSGPGIYKNDAEFQALLAEVSQAITKQGLSSVKRGGPFAYRGRIPAKFITKFREYPKKKFPSSESKGVGFEEYQETRQTVLDKMKRYSRSSG